MDEALERMQLLEVDPELGGQLSAGQLARARRELVVSVQRLPTGRWDVAPQAAPAAGFLVVEGCLTREVAILAESAAIEFVAVGDVLRPWLEEGSGSVDSSVVWQVLEPTRLAMLDLEFLRAARPWPEVTAELLSRQERRAEGLTSVLAISHLPRVDLRVLVLFWHFADRWGKVRGGEVSVPVPLTHLHIARLVGAQRPTVTTALHRLGAAGLVVPRGKGEWLLRGGPPTQLRSLPEGGAPVPTSRRVPRA